MRRIHALLFSQIIVYSVNAAEPDDCSFIDEYSPMIEEDPIASAQELKFTKPEEFLGIYSPPISLIRGFESNDEVDCALENYEFEVIRAGNDFTSCNGGDVFFINLQVFVKSYNSQIRKNLIEQGSYVCTK